MFQFQTHFDAGKWRHPLFVLLALSWLAIDVAGVDGQLHSLYPVDGKVDGKAVSGAPSGSMDRSTESDGYTLDRVTQSDRVSDDWREYRSMSPQSWTQVNQRTAALSNPNSAGTNASPRNATAGGKDNRWQSEPVDSYSMPGSFQSSGQSPAAEPSLTLESKPFGEVRQSSFPMQRPAWGNPVVLAAKRTQDQDMFGTPPVPSDIREDLEMAPRDGNENSVSPESQGRGASQSIQRDSSILEDRALPGEWGSDANHVDPLYSDTLARALLGVPDEKSVWVRPLQTSQPVPSGWQQGNETSFHLPQPSGPVLPFSAAGELEFRPDLGHRSPFAIERGGSDNDYGQSFDFEEKYTEYPSLSEILAAGRYFGSVGIQYVKPAFQSNVSIFREVSGVSATFDFGYATAPQVQFGFQSQYGPGVEFTFSSLRDVSRPAVFTSDGIEIGTTSVWMRGANQFSRLSATNFLETLTSRHRLAIDDFGVCFFKDVAFKKTRLSGKFGLQSVRLTHQLNSQLTNAAGVSIGSLQGRSDLRAAGPQFQMDYFRPVGHTKIEFLASVGGSILFGKQSQSVVNSTNGNLSRLSAREFVATTHFFSGAQYRHNFAENRFAFVRTGVSYQVWLNGGTAILPQDDFGLRGLVLTAGINR